MLYTFSLENFKGIVDVSLKIKPITILIGINGTGKSSIGQALLLLKQSLKENILIPNGE